MDLVNAEDHTNSVDSLSTIAAAKGVPQSHAYEGDRIYIRDCYAEYYGRTMVEMATRPFFTVTGTLGVGKSMFYLYFFQRYREEHPDRKVFTVAFDVNQQVMEWKLWYSLNEIN